MAPFILSPPSLAILSFLVWSMRWSPCICLSSRSYVKKNHHFASRTNNIVNANAFQFDDGINLSYKRTSLQMGSVSSSPGFLRTHFSHFPWNRRLPNLLTYVRCIAVPVFMLVFLRPQATQKNILLTTIFGVASITDYLDGFLARRWNVESTFGAFLDPVADKLMCSTALILLSGQYGSLISVPTAIILAREIAISALREWMAQQSLRDIVQVGWQGKVKTASTMAAIFMLLLASPALGSISSSSYSVTTTWPFSLDSTPCLWNCGIVLLYMSTLLTISSACTYFKAAASVWTR